MQAEEMPTRTVWRHREARAVKAWHVWILVTAHHGRASYGL